MTTGVCLGPYIEPEEFVVSDKMEEICYPGVLTDGSSCQDGSAVVDVTFDVMDPCYPKVLPYNVHVFGPIVFLDRGDKVA